MYSRHPLILRLEGIPLAENKKSDYRNKWIADKLDRVNLTMPKGQKETVKAHAEACGESVNAFINRAVLETMERDNAATD